MATYKRPQVTVEQSLTITPTSADRDQPAFVFGPNYKLNRYGIESNSDTYLGTWEDPAAGKAFDCRNVVDPGMVDVDYTRLYGENLVVELASLASPSFPEYDDTSSSDGHGVQPSSVNANGGYTILFFSGKNYVDKTGTLDVVERPIVVGDTLKIDYTSGAATTLITSVVSAKYYSDQASLDEDSYNELAGAGTVLVIADPVLTDATSVSVSLCKKVAKAEFGRKDFASQTEGKWQWEQDFSGEVGKIKVNELSYLVDDYGSTPEYKTVKIADLYVSYRELDTSFADEIHSVANSSDVSRLLNTVDADNPLAMGVYMAAINAASDDGLESPSVFFMAIPEPGISGYEAVLSKATLTDRIYTLAPTTRDEAVIELVKAHVNKMSSKEEKQWRIGSVSKVIPEDIPVLYENDNLNNDPYYAIPVSLTHGTTPMQEGDENDYDMIRIVNADGSVNSDVRLRSKVVVGDVVRFNLRENAWGEDVFDEYKVVQVINDNTVRVNKPVDLESLTPSSASYDPEKSEIWHHRTSAQMAEAAASVSKALASRRMINVFPDSFENNGVTLTGEFAACAVAGRISSCQPQQPMTNLSINGIDEVPVIYLNYNKDELDLIASGGTFIIAQDLPNDKVYIRHQITTAYPDGNLNTAELSITKNLDSISYAFADLFRPYIGKYNITPDFILGLGNLTSKLIGELGSDKGSVYGPQLIIEGTEILWVKQNELYKDHVDICVRLNMPYPCNNIDIVLVV